jgi:hypothetical protein
MQRLHSQQGAVLILVIGIVAALAVLAATLVAVTVNAQSGTYHDRMRAKAANVAEGGIDAVLSAMSTEWPKTADQAVDTTALEDTVRGLFPTGGDDGNPNPPTGKLAKIYIYDNSDTNHDGKIDRYDFRYDSYADDVMNVEVQANVGGRKAGIVTQVTASTMTLDTRANTALYAGGVVTMDGVNKNKSAIGIAPGALAGTTADVIAHKGFDAEQSYKYGCGPNVTPYRPPEPVAQLALYDVTPEATLDALQQKCFATKKYPYRYYTSASAASGDDRPLAGVVVVDPPVGTYATVDLSSNATSQSAPGILIVTRGKVIEIGGTAVYYGLIVVRDSPPDGTSFDLGGNASIHGMVVVAGNTKLHGTDQILFDPAISLSLQQQTVVLKVRMVPNTWRQVKPE